MREQEWTIIPVMYRDAANYKSTATLIATGAINDAQKDVLRASLEEGEKFVATQIGIPHLGVSMIGFPDADDHGWHELDVDDITTRSGDPALVVPPPPVIDMGEVAELVARFARASADGWETGDDY